MINGKKVSFTAFLAVVTGILADVQSNMKVLSSVFSGIALMCSTIVGIAILIQVIIIPLFQGFLNSRPQCIYINGDDCRCSDCITRVKKLNKELKDQRKRRARHG